MATLLQEKTLRSILLSFAICLICLTAGSVLALSLTTLSDTQSTIKVSELSDHTIQFVTPSGVSAGATITIDFPAGYTFATTSVANIDFATSTSSSCSSFSDEVLAATPSGATWGVATSSGRITITSGSATIPANRCIQIRIGSNATFGGTGVAQIVNPSTPGLYQITIGGTFGDTGVINETIIDNDTIALTGTVAQSITFSLSTSTIFFGTLSDAQAKYASSTNTSGDTAETVAHTLLVSTNAPSGFALTVRGQTLTSLQNNANTITEIGASAASSTPGVEQFGLRVTESGGIGVTVDSTFSQASSYGYDGSATVATLLATGSGSTPTSTLSVRYLANINAITEAGTYSANLTYVATANF